MCHFITVFDTVQIKKVRLVSLAKVGLTCSEGSNGVSRAFFHLEIGSESNFDLESHLVLLCSQNLL